MTRVRGRRVTADTRACPDSTGPAGAHQPARRHRLFHARRSGPVRPTVLLAVVCAAALAAACGTDGGVGDRPPPAPAAAAVPAAAPEATNTAGCTGDVTASLRPGTLPSAGSTLDSADYPQTAKIQKSGHLVVGIDQSTYPFGYIDPVTGRLRGFDIEVLRTIAQSLFGGSLQDADRHLWFRVLNNDQRASAVAAGDVDLVAETMTINCDRRHQVDFSTTYFQAGQRVLVNAAPDDHRFDAGLSALRGRRVCAVPGSTSLERVKAAAGVTPVQAQTWADCLVLVQQGRADAVSTDDAILAGLQAQDPLFTKVVGPALSSEPYGVAVAQSRPDLVRYVNGVLEQMREDGRWSQIYRDSLGTSLSQTVPSPPVAHYRD